ncbi:protein-arginine deiminase family protein [Chondromyces crocatus]|uniref:Protein-arginine deiminase C-terminal domain-containing protein n=1 Tax=Chondromyces crocatus TaxID=52 RepID=A0A0K1ECP5_CHOCO|nr:protein-arginine deiminase family protein [Chondromyces crocatus]AKT38609.1 uncharacterized protein CMC5_027560 [Chondromyces crocatus]
MVTARWLLLGAAVLTAGAAACSGDQEDLFPNQATGGSGGTGGSPPTTSSATNVGGGDVGGAGGVGGDGGSGGASSARAIVDLRADVNRDGVVDLNDPDDDVNEDTWDAARGAIFLANIDDDRGSCPKGQSVSDSQLAACNDAADEVVNGPDDLLDLARLRVAPWPDAPADASATVTLNEQARSKVRLFKADGDSFTALSPEGTLTAAELQAGIELAIEGRDIVRDLTVWDGFAELTLTVEGGTRNGEPVEGGTDTLKMRVAPVLLRHHLDPAERVYVTRMTGNGSTVFRQGLATAVNASNVPEPTLEMSLNDQWTQDFFETGYMAMPGPGGQKQVIHVNFRSANYTGGSLRSAGRIVFTTLRGKDVAGAVQYDTNHANSMDSLNSFGNTETIPPFTHEGRSYPVGRVLRGKTASYYPDQSFDRMLVAQGYQPPVYLDTSWLLVGHVDETTSFVKAPTARGWALVVADSGIGVQMLQQARDAGYGSTEMFASKGSARTTINAVLNDPDLMNTSAWAAAEVDSQVEVLVQETGITEDDIVRIGSVWESESGYAVAYVPGMVNGIYLSDTDFAAPDPFGPVIGGQDIFKQQMSEAFAPLGIAVHWIDNWALYHRMAGEVHCGTNTTRAIPAVNWWEGEQ